MKTYISQKERASTFRWVGQGKKLPPPQKEEGSGTLGGVQEEGLTLQKREAGNFEWAGWRKTPPQKEKGAGTFGEGKTITLQEKEGQVLLGVWGRGKHSLSQKKEEGEVSQVPSDGQQSRTE